MDRLTEMTCFVRAVETGSFAMAGRALSARIASATVAFGPEVEAAMAFGERPENGVTLATTQGARTLDTAIAVLGQLAGASALATTQYPRVEVAGDGGPPPAIRTPTSVIGIGYPASSWLTMKSAGGVGPQT